jgi:hypothetical protein
MTHANKQALAKFTAQPEIKQWVAGTTLRDSTRDLYVIKFLMYLGDESSGEFLERARNKPKDTAIEIKGRLGELYRKTPRQAHLTKYALKSFLDFFETDVSLARAKFPVRRVRRKPSLTWEQAEKIIVETDEPYRSLFRFMLWAGIGEDEIVEIQKSPAIQAKIEAQRSNPYIRIDLEPRKGTLDDYFTLVPNSRVPQFPLKTKQYVDRGAVLLDPHDMQTRWRVAAKKVHVWQVGFGPHSLRSAFRTQCDRAAVADAIAEFCMGHGSDRYGYSRPDEAFAARELAKMWEYNLPVAKSELDSRDKEIAGLRADIQILQKFLNMHGAEVTVKNGELLAIDLKDPSESPRKKAVGK